MRKQWIGVCVAAGLLAACSTDNNNSQQANTAPQPAVCNGPNVEITGADPRPEALSPTANQDYQRDGKQYRIVQDPSQFSQTGLAAIDNSGARTTATGETWDTGQLTAAHPTLPVPGYARITNLANGRMIVVRINDRGPYSNERIITLSQAAADRLNTSNNTKVRVDPIIVAQDGTLSGPGTACTTIARQTYALPARPDLSGNGGGAQPAAQQNEVNGQAPQQQNMAQPAGVDQQQPDTAQPAAQGAQQPATPDYQTATGEHNAPVTAPGSIQGASSTSGSYVVQVGAVSDGARANQWQQQLSQQYSVPGRVAQNGPVWRIQLGPFATRGEAVEIQQRLLSAGQPQSFVTSAQ
ncbi:endolytic peptidoglycan transglycosylase RlpA [Jejubacter calystegiae]|uniref:Endolytic peptidoglycan transglycosylase RlpA n=1 Tax=Jejubacter calystegiae TaxID=2579935 RepID=A0A4P8YPF4_9ENTR|nr:endolytic peptidoglycan transglycosylase RlpA [Jejubacter calystegiae]QCT20522.1 endolytic peptidoglycan transglycosylase RlpA [Jejubacter calystegiae]